MNDDKAIDSWALYQSQTLKFTSGFGEAVRYLTSANKTAKIDNGIIYHAIV